VEGGVFIDGKTAVRLHTGLVLVRGGLFHVGTEKTPATSNVEILLYGAEDVRNLPVVGAKSFGVLSGEIQLHGKARTVIQTTLAKTAAIGDTVIELTREVDWVANDEIVIASTSLKITENEEVRIASVDAGNKKLVTLTAPLQYQHLSGESTLANGDTLTVNAEVGLLSRNVRVLSWDAPATHGLHGGKLFINGPSIAKINHVEFGRMGQRRSRYPDVVTFMNVESAQKSYFTNNAIRHTMGRGLSLINSNRMTLENNVFYNVAGRAVMIDAFSKFNSIKFNLVIHTRRVNYLENWDFTPSAIFIQAPTNVVSGNKVVASYGPGIYYRLDTKYFTGRKTCPRGETLGQFTDNLVHSSYHDGFKVDPQYFPRERPCDGINSNNLPVQATFSNFQAYKVRYSGVYIRQAGKVAVSNARIFDVQTRGVYIPYSDHTTDGNTVIENSLIVGTSTFGSYNDNKNFYGIITSEYDGLDIKNIRFAEYSGNQHAIRASGRVRTVFLSGLTFSNVGVRVQHDNAKSTILVDIDGSLTGEPGNLTYHYPHLEVTDCAQADTALFPNSIKCKPNVELRAHTFNKPEVRSQFYKKPFFIETYAQGGFSTAFGSRSQVNQEWNHKYSWETVLATGYRYKVDFGDVLDFTKLRVNQHKYVKSSDKAIELVFKHIEAREDYDVLHRLGSSST
jgi:hypothetical protein